MSEDGYADQSSGEDNVEQLQQADTLIDRGVDDVLDEGYIAPDNWSPAQGFGNTPAEMRQRENLDMRVKQEEPEAEAPDDSPWNPDGESREVGSVRAGRLVDTGERDHESVAFSVGIDGGAASAEEAAMHVITPEDDDDVV
ncbi:hypothetical protein J4N02_06555 [Propioniciclava sp. MC1595]|uniref:DUF5709 domain-containing protein n=1 Tax=unclassified Propioniciclava TaxID=2642922 RepID=UPI0016004242|nr:MULTISPECIES: DUF5709 domain-containing protein [unclassified Propioniciclava]MBB1494383.1 hypothetical protein [Propioniciclava sp. MC1595]MBB1500509.1 hypothetical protein [Propioniciclava sp. MC1683]QTE27245.1 hypothetical protein J4N02_06555 [Propioniciclava sp. MC1595]